MTESHDKPKAFYAWIPDLQEAEANGDAMVEIKTAPGEGYECLVPSAERDTNAAPPAESGALERGDTEPGKTSPNESAGAAVDPHVAHYGDLYDRANWPEPDSVQDLKMRLMRKAEHAADWQSRAEIAERQLAALSVLPSERATVRSAHVYQGTLGPRVAVRYNDDTEEDRPATELEVALSARSATRESNGDRDRLIEDCAQLCEFQARQSSSIDGQSFYIATGQCAAAIRKLRSTQHRTEGK